MAAVSGRLNREPTAFGHRPTVAGFTMESISTKLCVGGAHPEQIVPPVACEATTPTEAPTTGTPTSQASTSTEAATAGPSTSQATTSAPSTATTPTEAPTTGTPTSQASTSTEAATAGPSTSQATTSAPSTTQVSNLEALKLDARRQAGAIIGAGLAKRAQALIQQGNKDAKEAELTEAKAVNLRGSARAAANSVVAETLRASEAAVSAAAMQGLVEAERLKRESESLENSAVLHHERAKQALREASYETAKKSSELQVASST